jgi:hypothetical protein
MLQPRQWKSECAAVAYLERIVHAETAYVSKERRYASVSDLIEAKLLDPRFNAPLQGYEFSVVWSRSEYTASAVPVSGNSSRHGYYATKDGVVRFSTSGVSGKPVQ